MSVYISLLRGINVGGSKIVSMDTLCDLYASLGFNHVRTYVQSGNVLFVSPLTERSRVVELIESRIEQIFGFRVAVFVRDRADFKRILTNNPFLGKVSGDTKLLHVSFLYRTPQETAWDKLDVPADIPDKLARGDTVIYLYYPNGTAKAKISSSYLEKILGVPVTLRNWNTVNALYKMASEI